MSLKFNDAIDMVAEKLLNLPTPELQAFLQDASEISEKMDQELTKMNSIFKGSLSNWVDTAYFSKTFMQRLYSPVLWLKLPFTVEPQRIFDSSSDEGQPVNLKTSAKHPAVINGYLNGEKLMELFLGDLNTVIDRISNVTCTSGKNYKISIQLKRQPPLGHIFNILAYEEKLKSKPSITYDFALSFTFLNDSSLYLYGNNFFHQSERSVESDYLKEAKVTQKVFILLTKLLNQPLNVTHDRMQELWNFKNLEVLFAGSALLQVIPRFIPHLPNPGPLKRAYLKLLHLKHSDSVQLSQLNEVFGLK